MGLARYPRLYGSFLRFAFGKSLEFRMDFFFRIVMDLVFYAVNIAFFQILFLHTDVLGGWNETEALVFVAIFLVVDAIHMTMFTNNLWALPFMINEGSLDYYLVRPVSTLFFVSLREFSVSSAINLIFASGIMVWALAQNLQVLTPAKLAMLPLLLLNGSMIHYLTAILFVIPTFWTHSGKGFSTVYHIMSRFTERPDALFRGTLRVILTTVLPLSLIASFPARLLLGPFDPGLALHLVGVSLGFLGVILALWRFGLRAYASASS